MRPESPLDPELRSVELSRGPLFYSDTGSGRTIVALHGAPANSRDFRWLDSALEGRVRLLRLDLPGFGRTPVGTSGGETVTDLGAVVVEFCEAADLQDAIVLGHSIGGAVAIDAATRTDRLCGAVLANSSGPRFHRGIFPRTYALIVRIIDLHRLLLRLGVFVLMPVARAVGFSKRLTDAEMVFAARVCARYDPGLMEEQLRGLHKPVLVAYAKDDPTVEAAVSEDLIACLPDPEVLPFDTGGHNLQSSQAVELADAIIAWVDELP